MWPFTRKPCQPVDALSEAAALRVRIVFAPADHAAAIALLETRCGAQLPLWHAQRPEDYDRIRFAVMKLSQGRLDLLEERIEQARIDWRDVLVAAGFSDPVAHLEWLPQAQTPPG